MTTRTGCWRSSRGPGAGGFPPRSPGGVAWVRSSFRRGLAIVAVCLGLFGPSVTPAFAHSLTITQVLVSFDRPGKADVKIDIDLTSAIGSAKGYYELAAERPDSQRGAIDGLVPGVLKSLQLYIGNERLRLVLQRFSLPKLSRDQFLDPATDHFTTLDFAADLPSSREPLRLVVPPDAVVDYPVAFVVQIPRAHISDTRWIEDTSTESEPFDWYDAAPQPAQAIDFDSLPWPRQLAMYLRLGFRHIVPEGTDHILFVLGLFFLGITWRKLLARRRLVFYRGIACHYPLPIDIRHLQPAEQVCGTGHSALHSLHRAGERVQSAPWDRKAGGCILLRFDPRTWIRKQPERGPVPKAPVLGSKPTPWVQLPGWMPASCSSFSSPSFPSAGSRNRPWFRARIAIPCSLAIAAVGVFWAVQRIVLYRHLY